MNNVEKKLRTLRIENICKYYYKILLKKITFCLCNRLQDFFFKLCNFWYLFWGCIYKHCCKIAKYSGNAEYFWTIFANARSKHLVKLYHPTSPPNNLGHGYFFWHICGVFLIKEFRRKLQIFLSGPKTYKQPSSKGRLPGPCPHP